MKHNKGPAWDESVGKVQKTKKRINWLLYFYAFGVHKQMYLYSIIHVQVDRRRRGLGVPQMKANLLHNQLTA